MALCTTQGCVENAKRDVSHTYVPAQQQQQHVWVCHFLSFSSGFRFSYWTLESGQGRLEVELWCVAGVRCESGVWRPTPCDNSYTTRPEPPERLKTLFPPYT